MKSREEYEASIYKKRDAFIVKRKKNIRITASALSVMICLGAAAVAIPMLREKTAETPVLPITNAAGGITENKIAAEIYDEIGTYPVTYDTGIAFTNQHNFGNNIFHGNVEGEEITAALTTEIYRVPDSEIATETEPVVDGAEVITPDDEEHPGATPSNPNYKTEEIVAEAKKYVNDENEIIDDKTNVTVSRNANGITTYTAYFYTENKRITVELDSNLKLIEVKEKDSSGDAVQITPGYNPDEE